VREWKKAGLKIRLGPFSAFFESEGGNGMGGETGSQKRLGRTFRPAFFHSLWELKQLSRNE
jgi:hypothetical protein